MPVMMTNSCKKTSVYLRKTLIHLEENLAEFQWCVFFLLCYACAIYPSIISVRGFFAND